MSEAKKVQVLHTGVIYFCLTLFEAEFGSRGPRAKGEHGLCVLHGRGSRPCPGGSPTGSAGAKPRLSRHPGSGLASVLLAPPPRLVAQSPPRRPGRFLDRVVGWQASGRSGIFGLCRRAQGLVFALPRCLPACRPAGLPVAD